MDLPDSDALTGEKIYRYVCRFSAFKFRPSSRNISLQSIKKSYEMLSQPKDNFKMPLSFYTKRINVKCKDDHLNGELYRCRWLSNCHLDEFTQSSGYKSSVLFTVYSFQFLIKFGGALFHDFSLISLPQCLLDKVSILQEESKSSSLLLQSNQVKRTPHD